MKNLTLIIASIILLASSFTFAQQQAQMKIHKVGGAVESYNLSDIDSVTFLDCNSLLCDTASYIFPMETNAWIYGTNIQPTTNPDTIKAPAISIFEKTNEGLKFFCLNQYGYAYIKSNHTMSLKNKTVYYKWKVVTTGYSNPYCNVGVPKGSPTNCGTTTDHSWYSSSVIEKDTWYYSRIIYKNDSIEVKHSINNYDNQGGTVQLNFKFENIFLENEYCNSLAFIFNDNYMLDAYFLVNEAKIVSE